MSSTNELARQFAASTFRRSAHSLQCMGRGQRQAVASAGAKAIATSSAWLPKPMA
jgi:hypothetical protein